MILQLAESISAVTQILQFEEKSSEKRVLVLNVRIRSLYDKIATLFDPVRVAKSVYNATIKTGVHSSNRAVAQDSVLNMMHARALVALEIKCRI